MTIYGVSLGRQFAPGSDQTGVFDSKELDAVNNDYGCSLGHCYAAADEPGNEKQKQEFFWIDSFARPAQKNFKADSCKGKGKSNLGWEHFSFAWTFPSPIFR